MRARNRSGRHAARRAAAWFTRPSGRMAIVAGVTAGVVVTVTPANGAATDLASHVASTIRQLVITKSAENAVSFAGTPAVGALFTTTKGKLDNHFCTASVIDSPHGDLVLTAAHCVANVSGTIAFVPGYDAGATPYGTWLVSKVYVDKAWSSNASQNDDVAILQVAEADSTVPIEDVTGAEQLAENTNVKQMVEVVGYPDGAGQAVACKNWTTQPMADQLEFDCGGYTDGTSGGPFLADVNPATGQGTVIGVIGGYEQGGYTPQVSYSIEFESNVSALYATAIADG
jgi:V8-like Glu-specific endopeptidase